ncbi:FecR family protein [Flavobacterium sp. NRK1]|uniref:FecR family protein n=1 Tax=Flavobacterium sp. NRK1 TaxID=2954929 RepID=UPI002093392F|nr:FecR domain-containing protein [Flavobacterium sp. NRK1]MCO6149699.1 FecR domain-containing protein [Flavobacterium sp. NRK1]
MKKEDFLILVKKYEENNCTTEEKKLVEYFFDSMQNTNTAYFSPSDEVGYKLLNNIKAATGQPIVKRKRKFAKRLQIAAALFVIAGLAITSKLITSPIKEITQIAAKGEHKKIILQDGSMVFLNSNSSVTYPETFGKTRKVTLTGEAYFKVHRNIEQPFVVATHDVSVKVLGTSFNINSYDHNNTKVSVLTGKVEVSSPSGKKVILTKNLQAVLNKNLDFLITKENSNDGIAWTENTIFLKNTTLGETARIIENWYNIQVDFEDKDLKQLIISGKFKDEKLENVLNSIALLKELEIKYITKNHVLIRKNNHAI